MNNVYAGMTVQDETGPVGVVQGVEGDSSTGAPIVVVQRSDGSIHRLVEGMFRVNGDTLLINSGTELGSGIMSPAGGTFYSPTSTTGGIDDPMRTRELPTLDRNFTQQTLDATGDELRIPVIREDVVVQKRQVEGGGVRVHKIVNEREQVIEEPTYQENVDVQRIAVGRVVDAAPQVREEGDTLIIPVMEEMLVVEKRLVLKEEIRITKRRTQETEQARVVLREEQVQIEQIDDRSAGL